MKSQTIKEAAERKEKQVRNEESWMKRGKLNPVLIYNSTEYKPLYFGDSDMGKIPRGH